MLVLHEENLFILGGSSSIVFQQLFLFPKRSSNGHPSFIQYYYIRKPKLNNFIHILVETVLPGGRVRVNPCIFPLLPQEDCGVLQRQSGNTLLKCE